MACYIEPPHRELMLDLLLEYGADIELEDSAGEILIEETVKVLLESGAEVDVPNHSGRTPLSYHNDIPVMKQLLAHGADPDFSDIVGNRPLMAFILRGNYEAVELLIDHGADPTYKVEDESNYTYLHAAAMIGHPDILKLLLNYEADIGAQIDDRSTAWDLATNKECRQILSQWATKERKQKYLSGHGIPDPDYKGESDDSWDS
ncbi:hypothetical protein PENFLA_c012G01874 [Penicillium flavigenum]|uniref:Uncharacterized protein n=1 Tax=Penicillium flavigenum TaxID=254877 RepID=A0A1V6TAA6_9EURO|nr:hypothetical protein PENFLA_c012G01874 [Penicillium flavigenum]